jgi:hypothetical protein
MIEMTSEWVVCTYLDALMGAQFRCHFRLAVRPYFRWYLGVLVMVIDSRWSGGVWGKVTEVFLIKTPPRPVSCV